MKFKKPKRVVFLILIFLIIAVILLSFYFLIEKVKISKEKYCEKDNDCIEACLGCCVCKRGVEAYNREYIQGLGIDPSGNCTGAGGVVQGCTVYDYVLTPACIKNNCALTERPTEG